MTEKEFKEFVGEMLNDMDIVYSSCKPNLSVNQVYFNCYYFLDGVKRAMIKMDNISADQYTDACKLFDSALDKIWSEVIK